MGRGKRLNNRDGVGHWRVEEADEALMCGVGLISVLLAQTLPLSSMAIPGFWYAVSIPAYKTALGMVAGRRRRQLYETAPGAGS